MTTTATTGASQSSAASPEVQKNKGSSGEKGSSPEDSIFAMLLQGTLGVPSQIPPDAKGASGLDVAKTDTAKTAAPKKTPFVTSQSSGSTLPTASFGKSGALQTKVPGGKTVLAGHGSTEDVGGNLRVIAADSLTSQRLTTVGQHLSNQFSRAQNPITGLPPSANPAGTLGGNSPLPTANLAMAEATRPIQGLQSHGTNNRLSTAQSGGIGTGTPSRTGIVHGAGNAAESGVGQSVQWAAFAPVTGSSQPEASPSTPSVQFGDLKSLYGVTQAAIGKADGGNQQIQVQVHPQGLGNLLISVVQTPNGISVHMQAEQMVTAQWLTGQSDNLMSQLQQQGVDVSGVNVSFGSSNPQSSGGEGQQRRSKSSDGVTSARSVASSQTISLADGSVPSAAVATAWTGTGTGYSAWV